MSVQVKDLEFEIHALSDGVLRALKQAGTITKRNLYKVARSVYHDLPTGLQLRLDGRGKGDPIELVVLTLEKLIDEQQVSIDYSDETVTVKSIQPAHKKPRRLRKTRHPERCGARRSASS